MRLLFSVVQGVGIGLAAIGLLDLVFDGWDAVALVLAVIGVVLVLIAYTAIGRWRRAGDEGTARRLAQASELALARVDGCYPIRVRRPAGWTRLVVTVAPQGGESPYRTTLSERLAPHETAPADGALVVVARCAEGRADVRRVRDPDASWRAAAADPAMQARFPERNAVATRASWDTRLSGEEHWRSWPAALSVASGAVAFVAAAGLLGS